MTAQKLPFYGGHRFFTAFLTSCCHSVGIIRYHMVFYKDDEYYYIRFLRFRGPVFSYFA